MLICPVAKYLSVFCPWALAKPLAGTRQEKIRQFSDKILIREIRSLLKLQYVYHFRYWKFFICWLSLWLAQRYVLFSHAFLSAFIVVCILPTKKFFEASSMITMELYLRWPVICLKRAFFCRIRDTNSWETHFYWASSIHLLGQSYQRIQE